MMTPAQRRRRNARAIELIEGGASKAEAARAAKISRQHLHRVLMQSKAAEESRVPCPSR